MVEDGSAVGLPGQTDQRHRWSGQRRSRPATLHQIPDQDASSPAVGSRPAANCSASHTLSSAQIACSATRSTAAGADRNHGSVEFNGAAANGYQTDVWTLPRVAEVISTSPATGSPLTSSATGSPLKMVPQDNCSDRVRAAAYVRCRELRLEPPRPRSALSAWFAQPWPAMSTDLRGERGRLSANQSGHLEGPLTPTEPSAADGELGLERRWWSSRPSLARRSWRAYSPRSAPL